MRGAHACHLLENERDGIIPADAGSTGLYSLEFFLAPDHPRGCGEHVGRPLYPVVLVGSSPRMRGALVAPDAVESSQRIIPADAGSTRFDFGDRIIPEDHPRGCGEHWDGIEQKVTGAGSSPRMRGAQCS